jgi:hypothetical protein
MVTVEVLPWYMIGSTNLCSRDYMARENTPNDLSE